MVLPKSLYFTANYIRYDSQDGFNYLQRSHLARSFRDKDRYRHFILFIKDFRDFYRKVMCCYHPFNFFSKEHLFFSDWCDQREARTAAKHLDKIKKQIMSDK